MYRSTLAYPIGCLEKVFFIANPESIFASDHNSSFSFSSLSVDLHLFFEKVKQVGGYDGCTQKKTWKQIYDDLGGNPSNTSAATCTRKHYER